MAKSIKAIPKLANLARALARWDNEGGALAPTANQSDELEDAEERVLRCLGAAVILEWSDLPTDIQRRLFDGATTLTNPDHQRRLKHLIARFLHVHNFRRWFRTIASIG